MTTSTTTTGSHYQGHSQDSYESAFFYSPGAYMEHVKTLVDTSLELSASINTTNNKNDEKAFPPQPHEGRGRLLLDIGGGTGNFTKKLLELNPSLKAVVIDPFLTAADAETHNNDRIQFVSASAEEAFCTSYEDASSSSSWQTNYDHVLLKEVVHHLEDRKAVFRGMWQGFRKDEDGDDVSGTTALSSPNLLIITRPQIEIDYPLWPAARDVWAQNQPSSTDLRTELIEAGFRQVDMATHAYPCQIPLTIWQDMVRRRFWSTFSHFSDAQLEEACQDMPAALANRVDGNGVIHFEDRLVFLTAWK